MHEDLVADRLGVEQLARLGIGRRDEPAEQIRLLPEWVGVQPRPYERVGCSEQFVVLLAVALELLSSFKREREVGTRLRDARDALLRALGNCLRKRVGARILLQESEVVPARPAAGDLER